MSAVTNHPTRILLVDDDKDDCSFFEEALKETGIDATLKVMNECTGIQDILPKKGEDFPDLIFLDLNMPMINGKECLKEIRDTENLKDIPVIIFSTACRVNDVDETFAKGANLYVQKPSGFRLLTKVLKKIIELDWRKYLYERQRSKFVFTNR
jgi:CheY-like chemotaxis protein